MTQTDSTPLSSEEVDQIVLDHRSWAEAIARSVARAWNMDWRLDGLDGAAFEALLFCARRFDPKRGVPFKGYARRRIHEASTEEARKSRSWKAGLGTTSKSEQKAREVSARLFDIFPELREGQLPIIEEGGSDEENVRGAIRSLLIGANIASTYADQESSSPDELVEFKRMITLMASLEPIHQLLLWKTYWEGDSLRQVAGDWETDELNVMREHKTLIGHLFKLMSQKRALERPKVRPGLKDIALKLKRSLGDGPFSDLLKRKNS